MKVRIRNDTEFAEDMMKYSKQELITKLVNMRGFLLELVAHRMEE